ncbi:hypothetical protein H0O00_05125 [Candidatus Micrarchaeota archaeon]|nr:hypothetical protein [Candidatus Micrarchaeota archaeon]
MKKKETPAVPQISIPASPSAFKKADVGTSGIKVLGLPPIPGVGFLHSPREAVSAPETRKVPVQELLTKLKRMATGWDSEIEALFGLPETLFKIEQDNSTYYSKNEAFGIGDTLTGLQQGRFFAPLPEYGIGIFSTGGSVQIILIDSGRNIVVRGKLFSVHDPDQQKDWATFKEAINTTLATAPDARKQGGVAVFDGRLKVIKTP